MKIVFITLFKEGFGGGEGRVAHEMARHFSSHHDVVLICPGEKTGLYELPGGLEVFGVQSAGKGDMVITTLTGKHVNRIFEFLDEFQPDAVHAHEPFSLGLIGQVWAKMHRVPFAHTAHMLPSKILEFGAIEAVKLLKSPLIPLSESLIKQLSANFFENCDAIIALNSFVAKDIRQFGYTGRIFTIPNGRNLEIYSACQNTSLLSQEKVLTFIGKLSERKNQLYLLEALKHLPKTYRLQLIGEPLWPDYKQQLQDFATAHNLDVVFTGEIAHEDIPSYLEKTHVFVSASKLEVQSLVVLEALASGTPVVGLSNETIDELVDRAVGFRLPKDTDPQVFAQHVERICSLPQFKYNKICQNARDRVSGYDWANAMKLTVDAYQTLQREIPPVTEKSRASLTKMISLLPPGEVRDVLLEHAQQLEETIQSRKKPDSELGALLKRLRRVPNTTWLFVAITTAVCTGWYIYMKLGASAAGRKRFKERGESLKSFIRRNIAST
ncbi:MAG: glycosyltransferase [Anaerolineae bacterium]|nr:glycosyltransferase [Anaerolineae bacterium]